MRDPLRSSTCTRSIALIVIWPRCWERETNEIKGPLTMLLNASQWSYKAEGGANVAFAYSGPCDPALNGRLLRLRKKRATGKAAEVEREAQLLPHDPVDFVEQSMLPLLGKDYVIPGIRLSMSKEVLGTFQRRLEAFGEEGLRPSHRLKDSLDEDLGYSLLMLDHSLLPRNNERVVTTFCVELKPKCGIMLPFSSTKEEADADHFCRYCMHQLLKAAESEGIDTSSEELRLTAEQQAALAGRVSGYCPLSLYSRALPQAEHALAALTAHPQNNFRLFVNGEPVFTHESAANYREGRKAGTDKEEGRGSSSRGWSHEECLLHLEDVLASSGFPLPGLSAVACPRSSSLVKVLSRILAADDVLSVLARAQALDSKGVAEVASIYSRVRRTLAGEDNEKRAAAQVERFCAEALAEEDALKEDAETGVVSPQEARLLRDFMLAASAKDCSLLLAFSLADKGEEEVASGDGGSVEAAADWQVRTVSLDNGLVCRYSVAVVDLDPKPFAKIPAYLDQDREIREAWSKLKGQALMRTMGKTCGGAATDADAAGGM